MDFLDPHKRKRHSARLFLGYFLAAVIIIMATWILSLIAAGFYYNRKTGQVIQNGLIFLSSKPVSAQIYINGEKNGNTTNKLALPSGDYSIELRRSGYRSWYNRLNLAGGSVEQLTYPLLFPTTLSSSTVQNYSKTPSLTTQSPDQRWLLVLASGQFKSIDRYDLKSNLPLLTKITLPTNLLKSGVTNQKLAVVDWSDNNHDVLLNHTYKDGNEFIMLDITKPANSFNLNNLFKTTPSNVVLRNNASDQYYFYYTKTKDLKTASVNSRAVSTILTKVQQYADLGSRQVVYLSNDGKDKKLLTLKIWDGSKSSTVNSYPAGQNYKLNMASYSNNDYLIVGQLKTGNLYIYKNPLQQARRANQAVAFKTLKLPTIGWQSFSTNYRFIEVQNANRFGIYDIETDRRHYYDLDVDGSQPAEWMDGYRLVTDQKQNVVAFDFDGNNFQVLSSSNAGLDSYFNPDNSQLYSFTMPTQNSPITKLTQISLVVK